MDIGSLFGVFVMSFKIQKFPFLLILSAHFVVTSQLEEEKHSVKRFILDEEWENPLPEVIGNMKTEFDSEGFNEMLSAPEFKRSDCMSSCDVGSMTRKQIFQVIPSQSRNHLPSSKVICVRKSCIPDNSIDNNKDAEEIPLKNFLKDAGWQEILSKPEQQPKDENRNKMHDVISVKHEISVGDGDHKKLVPKQKVVFESVHVVKKFTKKPSTEVEGHWTPWSRWSPCTTTCNVGFQSRKRICVPHNLKCKMSYIERRMCIAKACHQAEKGSTLKILQGRDARLRCYGRNVNMKHLSLMWITPFGKVIRPSNKTKSRFQASGDVLHVNSAQKTDNGLYHCIWPPFKTGTGLSLDVESCDTSPCKNKGNCLESFIDQSLLKKTTCICTRKFRGSRCERVKTATRRMGIIFIVIIVCALLVTIMILCCCLRYNTGGSCESRDFFVAV